MTIGISIDNLLKIDPWQYDNQQDLLDAILDQCTELNPWLPIEQAPKDRRIRLYYPASKNGEYERLVLEKTYTDYFKMHSERLPTHYQELPADPK